ncbi:DUF167 family protein [Rhabdochromatium marinum]|uniref:DUF167 family protein n=1 Tax=Rhabdochromatium marinum TaxID=48729 RepID=UPI0019063996|nr:DUF167 family protein [Rhabdochromatium marinum]MBK1648699.1 YggU family protein [Rhabdochromatium marinum]
MDWYQWQGGDVILRVRVQPRARRDGFAEPLGEAIKLQLRAPPVDGKANASLIAFLAKAFGVSRAEVTLLSGEHSRTKRLRIQAPQALPAGIEPG